MLIGLLIATMVILPLRAAVAIDQSDCEMHDQVQQTMVDHSMHGMHQVDESVRFDVEEMQACCCCDTAIQCSTDCGAGMSVSYSLQSAVTVPALNASVLRTHVVNNLVFRDIPPPVRPPAYL